MASPYENLPGTQFWRTGVAENHPLAPEGLYRRKFAIARTDKIATAGSCFAQHIARHLRAKGFCLMDVERAPFGLSEERAREFGYGIYSARYGNIYTVRQLLQLAQDAFDDHADTADIWNKDGRFYDALRPGVEPRGLDSVEEALALRRDHLGAVRRLFETANLLIFTFGLTEAWVHRASGRAYPTAPGTIAGSFDPQIHAFKNFTHAETLSDFVAFYDLIKSRNPGISILLTVSPVPLTATAAPQHVLSATTYSKSVLRAVAGQLYETYADIDYFPSYEIVASPWSRGMFYEANLRSVNAAGVDIVMRTFFAEHGAGDDSEGARTARRTQRRARRAESGKDEEGDAGREDADAAADEEDDAVCEEVLLDAFSR